LNRDLYGAVMFSANPRPRRATAVVAVAIITGFLAAGCKDAQQQAPQPLGGPDIVASQTVSPSPSSSPSPSPSPSPSAVVAVSPTPPPAAHTGYVVPGAYCATADHNQYGTSSAGNRYRCSYYSSDGRWHWKRVTTTTPTKKPAPTATTHTHAGTVTPGAYCPSSEHGWYGTSSAGNKYRCSLYDNGQWRWKRV